MRRQSLLTFANDLSQGFTIIRVFCDGLAEVKRLPGPIINGKREMVGSYGTSNCLAKRLHSFDGSSGRSVLKDDAQTWETLV